MCVALGMQHAMRMRRIVICGLPGFTIFSTSSHKRHDFRKKNPFIGHKRFVLIFSQNFTEDSSDSKKK
jgi:hypothetical protein